MRTLKLFLTMILLAGLTASAQTKTVEPFTKVIVSPYIQVTFVEGDKESVRVDDIKVDENKLHIEVSNHTLRIYLDGAKDVPKYEKQSSKGYEETHPLYENTSVVATITYKRLSALSLRGAETHVCKSAIHASDFSLTLYGESNLAFTELNAEELETTIYGNASLNINSGAVTDQRYTCYGDAYVNSLAITGTTSRIVTFGDADLHVNVSDRIKITAYGDAKLHYKGNPEIVKGFHFGGMEIDRID